MDTLIAYHTSYIPDNLTDARWAEVFRQIEDIRKKEAEQNKG